MPLTRQIACQKHTIIGDRKLSTPLGSATDRVPSDFSSNAHRASNHVILAEVGTLSMEFTRLAQITGEQKYYDAIARITDNLEEFQNKTRLPGMWPTYLDASGCKRIDWTSEVNKPLQKPMPAVDTEEPVEKVPVDPLRKDPSKPLVLPAEDGPTPTGDEELSPEGHRYVALDLPSPLILKPNGPNPTYKPPKEEPIVWNPDATLKRRQLDLEDAKTSPRRATPSPTDDDTDPVAPELRPTCEDQGFASSSDYSAEEYTLGGESDSTYEYLSKQYLLLGGRVEKYRTMYETSMDVVKKHLIFRPMLPDENDILFSGKVHVPSPKDSDTANSELQAENAHLTCFAGGMFGMGAKIFDRPEDLEIAKKLTEGCVWSYNVTASGIMPEGFEVIPCKSRTHCPWNETKYWRVLDPLSEQRMTQYKEQMVVYKEQMSSARAAYEQELRALETPAPSTTESRLGALKTQASPTADVDILNKRQLDWEDTDQAAAPKKSPLTAPSQDKDSAMSTDEDQIEHPPTRVRPGEESPKASKTLPAFPYVYSPQAPLPHKEYVQNRIQEERLPPGVVRVQARNYILR